MSTSFLSALEARITKLCERYLPKEPDLLGDYDEEQIDDARACVLLVHAEIENYLEDLSEALAKCAVCRIEKGSYDALTMAFLFHAGTMKEKVGAGSAIGAAKGLKGLHDKDVLAVNGIKDYHLKKLFGPFYVGDDWFDGDLFAALNAFGSKRGEIAHHRLNPGIRRIINPYELRGEIQEMIEQLYGFDDAIIQLAPDIDETV